MWRFQIVVLRGIRGQNRLSIFCPLVHVLPTAIKERFCLSFVMFRPSAYSSNDLTHLFHLSLTPGLSQLNVVKSHKSILGILEPPDLT